MALSRSAAWTCAVAVLLVVASGLSTTAPAIVAADTADDGADRSIEGATRFRQEEFLRSDPEWVQRAVSDRDAFPDVSWGTPLTEDEAAEMNARVRFQKGADDAILAAANQVGYGGAMYDWEHGRRLVVFTTGDPDRVRDAVERQIPEGGSLRVEPVERTLDALTRTRDKVTNDWKELQSDGITVIAASVDVVRNDVEIRVLERTEAAVSRLREYGDAIRVVEGTPTVADSCLPDNCSDVWGGIRLEFHDDDWSHYCTAGYNVKRTDLNPDKLAMLTAGHCIWRSDNERWRFNVSHAFGTENANHGFHSGSFGDVGIISFDLADLPSPTNKYLANPASGTVNGVTGVMSFSSQVYGTYLCRIGIGSFDHHDDDPTYSGRRCGHITVYDSDSLGFTNPREFSCELGVCNFIHHMKVWDWDSWGGDSGGIVVEHEGGESTTRLMGSHVHSETSTSADESWFTTVHYAQYELEQYQSIVIEPCTNSACS